MISRLENYNSFTSNNTYSKNNKQNISYGYTMLPASKNAPKATTKDKVLAGVGSLTGMSLTLGALMRKQGVKNPFKVSYTVKEMLSLATGANLGGILMSSIGESKKDRMKKWKEGAFQMVIISVPMLLVAGANKLCDKFSSKWINNNVTRIAASVAGVYIGSNTAIKIANKLRDDAEVNKPKRKLKLVDMVANLDDAITVLILAKIPFAKKINVEALLPFIYTFTGFKSGTGDRR